MYVPREEANRLLLEQFTSLLETLRQKQAFLSTLWEGDDWAFVIKAQTLIEGAVTHAVIAHVGDARLRRVLEAMPLVGEEVSKLSVAKDLELLTSPQRRFVKKMASLRNSLAHRSEHAAFNFEAYTVAMTKDARRDWQSSILWFEVGEKQASKWPEILRATPRAAIHIATFLLLGHLAADGAEKEILRSIDTLAIETTDKIMRSPDPAKDA